MATEPGAFTVQAQDKDGNAVEARQDIVLNLSSTSDSGSFARVISGEGSGWNYDSVVIKNGSSDVTFYYRDSRVGHPVITAKDPLNTEGKHEDLTVTSRFKLLVTGVTNPTNVGVPSSVTVQAVDYTGTAQNDFSGTIRFTSTDEAAIVPADYTFNLADHGRHTFTNGVTFATEGVWDVTAEQVGGDDVDGTQLGIVVGPPGAGIIDHLEIITSEQSFPLDEVSSVITVQTQDYTGMPIPVSVDTTVFLKTSSTTGSYSTDNGVTWTDVSSVENGAVPLVIPAGTTFANFLYKDLTADIHVLKVAATATGDFGWKPATQNITIGVGKPAKFEIDASNVQMAGSCFPVTIWITDIAGNRVTTPNDIPVKLKTDSEPLYYSFAADCSEPTQELDTVIMTGKRSVIVFAKSNKTGTVSLEVNDTRPLAEDEEAYETGTLDIEIESTITRLDLVDLPETRSVHNPLDIYANFVDDYGNIVAVEADTTAVFSSDSDESYFSCNRDEDVMVGGLRH